MKRIKQIKGNIGMVRIKEIIRLSEQGISLSEISRLCNTSRTTVREYVSRVKTSQVKYEELKECTESELIIKLGIKKSGRRNLQINLNYEEINRELLRKNVTRQILWEELLERNKGNFYSYSQFCQNLITNNKLLKICMHQEYKAGEEVQIDYAGDNVPIYFPNSKEINFYAQIFVGCLPASKYCFVCATKDQTVLSWIEGITKMFDFFGGATRVINCDNAKSLINKANYYEPEIQQTFLFFSLHYNVTILPARVRKPQDKPLVENSVGNVQRQILARIRDEKFTSLFDLNLKLLELNEQFCSKTMKQYGKSRSELFNEIEKQSLLPLPQIPYKITIFKEAKVHIDYHIQANNKYYSVPYQYAQKIVQVRLTTDLVEVYHDNHLITQHIRDYSKKLYITKQEHMPAKHQFMLEWTPERFLSWGQDVGDETKTQIKAILSIKQHPQQAYRSCLGVLSLAKKYSNYQLELACKISNQHNAYGAKNIVKLLKNPELQNISRKNKEDSPLILHENLRGKVFH